MTITFLFLLGNAPLPSVNFFFFFKQLRGSLFRGCLYVTEGITGRLRTILWPYLVPLSHAIPFIDTSCSCL